MSEETQLVSLILIRWIVIYPMDSAIQRLNNRDQNYKLTGTAPQSPLQCLTLGVLSLIRQIPHLSLNDGIKQLLEQKMGAAPRDVQLPHSSGKR